MSARIFCLCFLLNLLTTGAMAQDQSSIRSKKILINSDTTVLDSLMIHPGSLQVTGYDASSFQLIPGKSQLVWQHKPYPADSVWISYRVIQFDFSRVHRRKSTDIIAQEHEKDPFGYVPAGDRYIEQKGDDIKTLGNISRGIGFGNRQDVTVNSNLNLRLTGKIQDEIDIIAAISDDNNPIQPEGNTQQIQDFDRVFIQLSKDSSRLVAGDFPMTTPEGSYFMKYNKKSRGLQFAHNFSDKAGQWAVNGEGAVSRGRFSRNIIAGIEGNQGPYRLSGANGETFIIIISGTERVYLDGEQLTRGEQNDYVINYNTGELSFTPRRLITQYSRIVVEFQYSDRNYGRSVVRIGGSLTREKFRIRANYFNEQDNKNQPFQQNLDDSVGNIPTRTFIGNAGDADQVYAPRATPVLEFDPNQITYVERDSNGTTYYLQASDQDTGTRYVVSFSYVGSGNGDYIQKLSTANGKVFEWIEPVGGISQGDYAPVEILIPPKRQQMFNLGFDYLASENTKISVELVRTDNDINTFSTIDKENDVGYGLRFDINNLSKLTRDTIKPWQLTTTASYEITQKDFRYIERYRNVEFDRKWNRTLTNPIEGTEYFEQRIANARFVLNKGRNIVVSADQSYYQQGSDNIGLAQDFQGILKKNGYTVQAGLENINSSLPSGGLNLDNRFSSLSTLFSKRSKWITTGLSYQKEHSRFSQGSDSLYNSSYSFERMSFNLSNGDSSKLNYGLTINRRLDETSKEGRFTPSTDGRDANLNMTWNQSRDAQFVFTSTYRQLFYLDTSLASDKPENTLQGRLETRLNLLKKLVTTNAYYQLGTGQEQRREYSYLEVGDGNGNYVWNDYDSNGIQSLNEFELASSFDIGRANFIRQFLPVQGFIKSYTSEYNQNLRVRPINVLRKTDKKAWKFVRRFSNVSSLKIQKKVTNNDGNFLNPFVQNVVDTSLLTTNSVIRSTLSFNQSSPIFGIDAQWYQSQNKTLLVNGVDSRNNTENKLRMRYNINKNYECILETAKGEKTYTSQFLTDRAFRYDFNSIKPQLGYQYRSSFRVEVYYQYFEAHNAANYGGEATYNHDFTAELRWISLNKGTIRTNFGLVNINYRGNDNSPVAYELLAGLKNGRNLKWNLQIERRFASNIQLLLNYDGRRSIDNPVIHIGRIQARYLF